MGSLSLLFGWTLSSCSHFKMASNWMVSELGAEASYETTWTIRQFSQIVKESKDSRYYLSSGYFNILDYGQCHMIFRKRSGYFSCTISGIFSGFASDCLNTGQYSDCVITCQDGT